MNIVDIDVIFQIPNINGLKRITCFIVISLKKETIYKLNQSLVNTSTCFYDRICYVVWATFIMKVINYNSIVRVMVTNVSNSK